MNAHKFSVLCSASALALLTACAGNPPRNEPVAYEPAVVNRASQYGYVSNIETIAVAARTSGGGAVLGAVLGGVIGHQIGSGNGRTAATGVGVVGGALLGNNIEQRNRGESDIYRVSVRMDNGGSGQFDYQRIDNLRVGDRVRVESGQLYLD